MTPIQDSSKKNEGYVYKKVLDKRMKNKPKFQINNLVRIVDIKKTSSKGDTINWSYNLYKDTEIINDTIPAYKIDNLPERYNKTLLRKTELSLKEKKDVMKKLNITQIKTKCLGPSLPILTNLFVNTRA